MRGRTAYSLDYGAGPSHGVKFLCTPCGDRCCNNDWLCRLNGAVSNRADGVPQCGEKSPGQSV